MKKRKFCVECKKELTGIKSKFCSETCYLFRKRKIAKQFSHLRRKNFPPKKCVICEQIFKPIRIDHNCCSKNCGKIDATQKRKAKPERVKFKVVKPFVPSHPLKIKNYKNKIKKHSDPLFVNSLGEEHDELKSAVQDFVAKGGLITKLPNEIALNTEDVHIRETFVINENFAVEDQLNELINEYDNTYQPSS